MIKIGASTKIEEISKNEQSKNKKKEINKLSYLKDLQDSKG